MRPTTLRQKLNHAIQIRLKKGDREPLVKLIKPMKKHWLALAKEEEDFRDPVDVYGYSDAESIENNLLYISDRWNCAIRLKWIIDGVENGKL